jgi:hypothetical protein
MKFRKQLGSPAVRDLILEAKARARELPYESVDDPAPSGRWLDPGDEDPAAQGVAEIRDGKYVPASELRQFLRRK